MDRDWMRDDLPYGIRQFKGGTCELFNRRYQAISEQKAVDEEKLSSLARAYAKQVCTSPTDNRLQTEIWFYNDSCPPWKNSGVLKKCEEIRESF